MRKIIAGYFMSLDGVTEAPHEWHFPYYNDEMGQAVQSQAASADTLLLGRQTWQEFAAYWPDKGSDVPFSNEMNNTPKLVASTTLTNVDQWQHSTLIRGNVAEALTALKQQSGTNISVIGSGRLVQSLLRDNVLDELRLLVHPIVVGKGKTRLFDAADFTKGLELVDAQRFSTGVMNLIYQRATSGQA
jgi:dihydrofolate reductase